jgi:hypothetical protein
VLFASIRARAMAICVPAKPSCVLAGPIRALDELGNRRNDVSVVGMEASCARAMA